MMPTPTQAESLWHLVAAAQLVMTLGLVGWATWSIRKVAKEAAEEADKIVMTKIDGHMKDPYAHPEAAAHYHGSLEAGIERVSQQLATFRTEVAAFSLESRTERAEMDKKLDLLAQRCVFAGHSISPHPPDRSGG